MKQHFVIGAAWSSASSWIEQALNLTIFVIIARLIGTEEFGLATMALAFVLLGEVLVRETLTEGIIARHTLEDGFLEATFVALAGLGVVIFIALLALSQVASTMYGAPVVASLMIITSPVVLLMAGSGVSTAILRRKMAFRMLAIRAITGVIVGGIVGVYLAFAGYGAWSLVGQRLAMTAVNAVLAVTAAQWRPQRLPKRSDFARIGGLGPQVFLLRATTLAMLQTPIVALGIAIGPHAVAIFALTWRLVEVLLTLIVTPLKSVAQSTLAVMRRENARTDEFFLELTQAVALVGFAAFAGLAFVADPAIVMVFGMDWRETTTLMPWFCLLGAIYTLTDLQESYLMALDRAGRYVKAVLFEAIVCVIIIAVASMYGIVFAAAAFAIRAVLFFPIRTILALAPEQISFEGYVQMLTPPVMIATGIAVSVGLWQHFILGEIMDIVYLASAVIIGLLVCCVSLVFLTPKTLARLMSFVNAVRQT